jgi:GDPmannose 4,6-dehydratase
MVQCEKADDFIIASGVSNSLEDFVRLAFAEVGLDWRDHTVLSDALRRPTDISEGKGDASKAERVLGWKAKAHMKDVVAMMVKAELEEPERRRVVEAMALDR